MLFPELLANRSDRSCIRLRNTEERFRHCVWLKWDDRKAEASSEMVAEPA